MAEPCSIATVANTLTVGTNIMSNIMLGACVIVGISLIVLAGVHYKAHRFNPKLTPLSKPIMYIALGLCLLAIPFLEQFVGHTGRSAAKIIEQKSNPKPCYDIDAPLH